MLVASASLVGDTADRVIVFIMVVDRWYTLLKRSPCKRNLALHTRLPIEVRRWI
jgi:hypothetical protein